MAVPRSSRNYPLVLKSDPINVGIVAAFDFAAEDGSTATSNGRDHSGNNRHYTASTTTPTIVQTAAGKGRDTSVGRTVQATYQAADLNALGLAVGTGDFSMYLRIRAPSTVATAGVKKSIYRLTDGGGTKMTLDLYELGSTQHYHWVVDIGGT